MPDFSGNFRRHRGDQRRQGLLPSESIWLDPVSDLSHQQLRHPGEKNLDIFSLEKLTCPMQLYFFHVSLSRLKLFLAYLVVRIEYSDERAVLPEKEIFTVPWHQIFLHFGLLKPTTFKVKTAEISFWTTFEKLWLLFISTSGLAVRQIISRRFILHGHSRMHCQVIHHTCRIL